MESKRMEITIGKLRTVITIWLLFAFEAIPERRVSEAAKPHDVKTIVKIKVQRISTGPQTSHSKDEAKEKIINQFR
jgi:hypothetical protein